jgi:2-dehydropantoate 2-reductase
MRTAILGAGSLGTILGAITTNAGGKCTLIDANCEHVRVLNEKGATITGFMELSNVPVHAITPDQMSGIYDLVIVLIKQTANEKALKALLPFLDSESIVCTLQNGIPEDSVAEIVGKERVVGGIVGWGGGWMEPGVAQLYTKPEVMRVEIGNPDGGITPQVEKVRDFLALSGTVDVKTDLRGIRWAKLLANCALSGMSAATGMTFGEIIDDDEGILYAARTADELIRVADAQKIAIGEIFPGIDLYDLRCADAAAEKQAIAILREIYSAHRPQKASMLQDMEKGIPCEIDYINGIVCEKGDVAGVATPYNDRIVAIVKAFEAGAAPLPTSKNLAQFRALEQSEGGNQEGGNQDAKTN